MIFEREIEMLPSGSFSVLGCGDDGFICRNGFFNLVPKVWNIDSLVVRIWVRAFKRPGKERVKFRLLRDEWAVLIDESYRKSPRDLLKFDVMPLNIQDFPLGVYYVELWTEEAP